MAVLRSESARPGPPASPLAPAIHRGCRGDRSSEECNQSGQLTSGLGLGASGRRHGRPPATTGTKPTSECRLSSAIPRGGSGGAWARSTEWRHLRRIKVDQRAAGSRSSRRLCHDRRRHRPGRSGPEGSPIRLGFSGSSSGGSFRCCRSRSCRTGTARGGGVGGDHVVRVAPPGVCCGLVGECGGVSCRHRVRREGTGLAGPAGLPARPAR